MTVLLAPLLDPVHESPPWGIQLSPLLDPIHESPPWGARLTPLFGTALYTKVPFGTRRDVSLPMNVPLAGLSSLMGGVLGQVTPGALTLKLFVNDVWPTGAMTAASYTEMSGQGYSSVSLPVGGWKISRDVSGASVAKHNDIVWQFTAGSTIIYGYYVVAADGAIRWAARFATSFFASTASDRLTLVPKMTFRMAT